MARILLTTLGSYGDLFPYIATGIELQKLSHQVTVATSATYQAKVESEQLHFTAVRPNLSLDDREMMRWLFDQQRGTERVLQGVSSVIRETYEDTFAAADGMDVIVSHPITMAAVMVAEKRRLPWISSVLAPMSFVSAYDPPVPAPLPGLVKLRVFGPGLMRAAWNFGKWRSRAWIQAVLELRRELRLDLSRHPMFEGSHSPGLVLALFSKIFAEPQLDWPLSTVVTGFPFYDGGDRPTLAPELEAFLDAGPAPVVFTLGSSAVGAAGDFYRDSLQAVQRLRTRAVFLTGPNSQGLPERLPENLFAWPYASHAQVFARASVIVHQGGIGTTAQALRSGKPMLVVPFAHDQFDNANRVRRLGAGTSMARSKYNARRAEEALRPLLRDPLYSRAAETAAAQIAAENGAQTAARAIDYHLLPI